MQAKAKKSKGSKKYVDAPRYKVIYGYENEFKSQFNKVLTVALRDVEKTLLNMVKK